MEQWNTDMSAAPKDGTGVLLWCPFGSGLSGETHYGLPDMVVGKWTGHHWASDSGDVEQGWESTGAYFVHDELHPKAWMPLPPPPSLSV